MTARIHYFTLQDEQRREEKLDWFRETSFRDIPFQRIHPDAKHNWLGQTDNDFEGLLPLVDKGKNNVAVFELASLGIVTNRDEWLIDISEKKLEEKMGYFAKAYNSSINQDGYDEKIKWSETLKRYKARGTKEQFASENIKRIAYRPFSITYLYHSDLFVDRHGQSREIFKGDNLVICFTDASSQKPFMALATNTICDLHLVGPAAATQCLPLYRYNKDDVRHDNITDWGLAHFRERYGSAESTLTRRFAPPSPGGVVFTHT